MNTRRTQIRIALFDDHAAIRDSMTRALAAEGSFDVVASGGSADEAVASGQNDLPELMLLDLQMPGGGLQAVEKLCRDCPFVKTVILSSDDSEHLVSAAFGAGAFGYLTKGQSLKSIIASLNEIYRGRSQFSAGLASTLIAVRGIATPWHLTDEMGQLSITAREEQILSRFAQGLTVEEIANSIGLAAISVGAYLTNILHKLHQQTLVDRALQLQPPG